MDFKLRDELILLTAIKSHSLWCENEIKSFYERLIKTNDKDSFLKRLDNACYKDGLKRNEVVVDTDFFDEDIINRLFNDYHYFLELIDKKIYIKRFVKRKILADEIDLLKDNYKDGKENILRDFHGLSSASKKESMDGATSSYNVYRDLRLADVSIDDMDSDKYRDIVGIAIHTDWLKRNTNSSSMQLWIPYIELDDWNKMQDLNFFYIMLSIIKKNPKRYYIKSQNIDLPNYQEEEKKILHIKNN